MSRKKFPEARPAYWEAPETLQPKWVFTSGETEVRGILSVFPGRDTRCVERGCFPRARLSSAEDGCSPDKMCNNSPIGDACSRGRVRRSRQLYNTRHHDHLNMPLLCGPEVHTNINDKGIPRESPIPGNVTKPYIVLILIDILDITG